MKEWRVTGERNYPAGDNDQGNRFYGYRQTDLLLPDGTPATFYGLLVGATVHVVAVEDDPDRTTYLVRQHRPNLRQPGGEIPVTIELPGGFTQGETPHTAAQKELADELGMEAADWEHLATLSAYPGASDELDHIFLASGLSVAQSRVVKATEQDMRTVSGPFERVYDDLRQGHELTSAQTLAALSIAESRLG